LKNNPYHNYDEKQLKTRIDFDTKDLTLKDIKYLHKNKYNNTYYYILVNRICKKTLKESLFTQDNLIETQKCIKDNIPGLNYSNRENSNMNIFKPK